MSLPLALSARRCAVATLIIASAVFAHAAAPVPKGWFVWPAIEPVAGTALDTSALNAKPLQRVSVHAGHFVTPDGARIRFWGSNLTSAEAFPASAREAAAIARRLAKGGINIARLHHLDNPWGVGTGGSIWPADRKTHEELDPTQLDRLHRLIGALQDEGIYTNLNLKVSKTLGAEDGFDPSVAQLPNFQKRVDIYDRRMIDLQKDYARRLLTTKNPYTGFAPAGDPAVAIVELNNENSLLGYWTKDLGRGFEQFPAPFREELRQQWNAWLRTRYPDDAALARAWQPAAGVSTDSVLPSDATWQTLAKGGAAATAEPGADATSLTLHVTSATGVDWHVQSSLHGLVLHDGAVYTVEFLAKASQPRKLRVGVGIDSTDRSGDPWRSFGLLEGIEVGTDWKPFRIVFPAHSVAGALAALSFNAGQSTGTVSIKELRLLPGCAGAGLQSGQSAQSATVPLPQAPSPAQWADWIHFLADTERAYAGELRDYLKNELHVQAMIICSQIDYGGLTGLNREQSMDFADGHAYWQHPDFPAGADWDAKRWTIRNTPQLDDFHARTFGELGNLALIRVAGKPFTVSEYDHPAPSEFAAEMYPELASFAARQDWDIIYPFCIGADGSSNPDGSIRDFFDQLHHPAKWSQSPFAARLFRRALVPPAAAHRELSLGSPVWAEQPSADVLWRQLIPGEPLDFLNVAYGVSDRPGAPGAKATITSDPGDSRGTPVRLIHAAQGNVYLVDSDEAAAVVGFIGGSKAGTESLQVNCGRFGRDFASVSAVSLDDKPLRVSSRVLITVVGRAGNQGTQWNAARTSLGANWGHGPTVVEHVPATISLSGKAARVVYALAPDGTRTKKIETRQTADALSFTVGAKDHTLHYEVVTP